MCEIFFFICTVPYSVHSSWETYPYAEKQSVYSTPPPTDWAKHL